MTDEILQVSAICLHCGYQRRPNDQGPADQCPKCGQPYERLEGKICHLCGYTRKPGDPGPDYACPKCGAVYEKTEKGNEWPSR